jgi:hypothetical protein
MLRVGFELTIPVLERAKTVHALERAATVIGFLINYWILIRYLRPRFEFQPKNCDHDWG